MAVGAAQFIHSYRRNRTIVVIAAVVNGDAVLHPLTDLFLCHAIKDLAQFFPVRTYHFIADAGGHYAFDVEFVVSLHNWRHRWFAPVRFQHIGSYIAHILVAK